MFKVLIRTVHPVDISEWRIVIPDVVIKLLHKTLRLPLLKKNIFPSLKHCSKLSLLHYILTFEDIDLESVLKYVAKSRADSKSYSHV